MNLSPTAPARIAWIDPTGQPSDQDRSRLAQLGLDVRFALDPSALITSLVHIQVIVLRLEHDTAMLEECLSLAQMPGRRIRVICRVAPQQLDLAVSAVRLGADQVISTQEWGAVAWSQVFELSQGGTASAAPVASPSSSSSSSQVGPSGMTEPRSVVFVDPASRQLLALAQKVAQTEVSALLIGPTGAGKEVMARVLHEASPRAHGPFVSLNCGALPEHLIEDMLFGHEKGAFSGAIRDHQGVFEQARGGTVFLDEVGEMPLHLQTRLLRVLQERCITRLGGSRTIAVDVRIVAATNKDLKQAMMRREFREDLYFRISTFTLRVMPLRERPMDILPLAAHVLQQHGTPGEPYRITDEARRRLLAYHWPGNVRELGNVIQRALVLCPGRVLTEDHLMFDDDVFGAEPDTDRTREPSGSVVGGAPMAPEASDAPVMPARSAAAGSATQLQPGAAADAGRGPDMQRVWADAQVASPSWSGVPVYRESHGLMPDGMVSASTTSDECVAQQACGSAQPGLQWAVRNSELKVIQDAIRNTSSREAAARLLGISPRTLRYKLAQMRDLGMMAV